MCFLWRSNGLLIKNTQFDSRRNEALLLDSNKDTIVAIATPPGKGGVGIIRLSGSEALSIARSITKKELPERQACYAQFFDSDNETIDSGIAIYFAAPKSFTGEDIVELHGHGGPVVQDFLVSQAIEFGARQARAGEFTERAFLNDKIDLTQAEAIADLIDSTTYRAAKGAMRSLQGEFSNKIDQLLKELIYIRMYIEAAIDFPEEEIDFLADEKIRKQISSFQEALEATILQAGQGALLRNGLTIVLAGKPNAGKSSLMNALAGNDAAIVTEVPGTTRDTISQSIEVEGLPIHLIDTAGIRESEDKVEKIGIERARKAMESADHIFQVIDASKYDDQEIIEQDKTTLVFNKADLLEKGRDYPGILVSAITGTGLSELKQFIKKLAGFESSAETVFTARRRHISALKAAQTSVSAGVKQLESTNAGELLADDLLHAQNYLNEITGEFSSDDLLGEIFSGFCIGK